ncbi:FKBP-type peptidyl-prolyl cis-trans isomerase [Humisphaera borealis]|uniref:Peptidyl-prolyl cis-trans isomerase n=1 Tax=Humisphaera borealis TaxID=2807512 RepID=A0A7M2X368_9BACT|nr:peptidylprolyl isomerase [Humisphaera borealis]QOV91872.1 peptidylprolyl isomerase [Humisphaera borealis]
MLVAKNTVVSFDYTLTDTQGAVLDSSQGGEPLSYLHGAGGIIPGLESQMEGKSVGDAFKATVAPEDAYGIRREDLVAPVSRQAFKGIADIKPGMQFQANTQQGPRVVTVVAVEGDEVTIDANHELAGKTLVFDVKVVSVREASQDELAHGHAHGPGGHHH